MSSEVSERHLRPISVSAGEARLTHTGVSYVATVGINDHRGKVTLNMQLSGKQRERVDVRVIDIVSNCAVIYLFLPCSCFCYNYVLVTATGPSQGSFVLPKRVHLSPPSDFCALFHTESKQYVLQGALPPTLQHPRPFCYGLF